MITVVEALGLDWLVPDSMIARPRLVIELLAVRKETRDPIWKRRARRPERVRIEMLISTLAPSCPYPERASGNIVDVPLHL